MMKRLSVPFAFLIAACGGGSSPDPAAPRAPGDGHADHDHAAGGEAAGEAPPGETPTGETPRGSASVKADLLAAEEKAYEAARPVFVAQCAKCHSKDSKKAQAKTLDHFDMTSYPFGGHHAAEITAEVRKALGIGGGKATMPKDHPGAVQGDDLALIAAWADAWDRAHEGGAHEGHGDGHDHGHHAP
jgi:hypothetical protein